MSAADNKTLLKHAFAETAKGNGRPFVDAMADDVVWTLIGTTAWSRPFRGRKSVVKDLLVPLNEQFAANNTVAAHRFVAEDDIVVVEARGHNTTKSGQPYRNTYCMVFRFDGGKVVEITEYADTALIDAVLAPPPASAAG